MTTTYAWAPITKVEQQDDGTVMVYGPAADAGVDRDKQRLNQDWLDQAMPAWMAEGGNVREQHDGKRAVGVGVGLTRDPQSGAHLLAAAVIDSEAIKKVTPLYNADGSIKRPAVLKGFSVGIKDPHVTFGKADAPNGEVDGGSIIEVSLVDRPSNPRTLFTMVKADAAGELEEVDEPEVEETEDDESEADADQADATSVKADVLAQLTQLLPDLIKHFAPKGDASVDTAAPITTEVPAEPAADATKTDTPDLAKVDGQVADMVKAAVAEAMKPLQDQLTLVKADLVKALELPVAGGPVAMRTASQTVAAREADRLTLRAQAAEFNAKADAVRRDDPTAAIGYREMANSLLAKADA
jgi:hypothetical protein